MLPSQFVDQASQRFATQFEARGNGFVYRLNAVGAPISISSDERDGFTTTFAKSMRNLYWRMVASVVAVLGLLVAVIFWMNDGVSGTAVNPPMWAIMAVMFLLVGIFVAGCLYVWNAPSRELSNRTPVGVGLSKEEIRRNKLARMQYSNLLAALGLDALLLLRVNFKLDLFSDENLYILALVAALFVYIAIQAFRKLRFDAIQKRSANA